MTWTGYGKLVVRKNNTQELNHFARMKRIKPNHMSVKMSGDRYEFNDFKLSQWIKWLDRSKEGIHQSLLQKNVT
jgi:hypothetical protein